MSEIILSGMPLVDHTERKTVSGTPNCRSSLVKLNTAAEDCIIVS